MSPTIQLARPLDTVQSLEDEFVNVTHGASLGSMVAGVIPDNPDSFVRLMS
jgi:hypothetical protein